MLTFLLVEEELEEAHAYWEKVKPAVEEFQEVIKSISAKDEQKKSA
jgi:hypothetical protein